MKYSLYLRSYTYFQNLNNLISSFYLNVLLEMKVNLEVLKHSLSINNNSLGILARFIFICLLDLDSIFSEKNRSDRYGKSYL